MASSTNTNADDPHQQDYEDQWNGKIDMTSGWHPCGYCENPAACRDNFETCWRETHTEMSE